MEVRKSGKIAIGIIAALGTIGALHFVIFKDRAALYEQQKANYDSVVEQYRQQGRAPEPAEMYAFRYETLRLKAEYWQALKDYRFFLPPYMKDLGNIDVREEQRQYWDILEQLMDRLTAGGGQGEIPESIASIEVEAWPRLSFLGERGWNFATDLPEQLRTQGIAVEDVMTQIRNENRLLNSLARGSDPFIYHQSIYTNLLLRVGMNLTLREQIKTRFGELAATLYTINRIDQVMQRLPEDFWPAATAESGKLREMYDLFRIEWPVDWKAEVDNHNHMRQGRALLHLIDNAARFGIQEISVVRGHGIREVRWEEFKPDEVAAEAAPAAAAPEVMMWDESMMFGGGGRGFEDGMGMGMGMGRFGGAAAAPPPAAGDLAAIAAPLEVMFTGANSSIMTFLYTAVNDRYALEVDRLELSSRPERDSVVRARAFINVLTFSFASGLMTEDVVDQNLNQVKRELYELSLQRPGARERAIQDGLVREVEGRFELTVPMPPDPAAAPAPAPAPAPAAAPVVP